MGICLIVDDNNQATISNAPSNECQGYMIPSAVEYQSFINPSLEIDVELFNLVSGALLVTFITGHVLGRIVRYLGKR
ncbi:hypothetical protein C9I92_25015 [Photobacterium ganghwense]|uniref:hypothetical protein n=2 Tax=Photobacterium ganghwense TaxID=320778 RepID=UPI000D15BFCB|nr:hypothetical protein [Photobacterium ganghwense]PSU02971.1 hypothetical protein C9I92_25015 [Photobacterium ganghwense]